MTETYAESQAQAPRGTEDDKNLWSDSHSDQDVGRVGQKIGAERLSPDRESRTRGTGAYGAVGGILHQLIEDARKQLAKSRECVVWYQEEVKESEEKLKNLLNLMELQELQQQQQEADDKNEENLAE